MGNRVLMRKHVTVGGELEASLRIGDLVAGNKLVFWRYCSNGCPHVVEVAGHAFQHGGAGPRLVLSTADTTVVAIDIHGRHRLSAL